MGKTDTLLKVAAALHQSATPFVFLDLFTAASTPEQLLATLATATGPFMSDDVRSIKALAAEAARDRHQAASGLLRLFDLLSTQTPSRPFVWLVDEGTEIRSLAYFPGLSEIERPFAELLRASHGAILTSSYLGLAADLFGDFDSRPLPGLGSSDLAAVPSLRSDSGAIAAAIDLTRGSAATLLPLVADMRDTRDLSRSLLRLLRPGGSLELVCRRHYEVLLMRSRGYAVSKRAAEVTAANPGQRLTDLAPLIGRTPGASRQYLRWLVEVGLLSQVKKRYDFVDPILGLWAGLYLGRGAHPSEAEISRAVTRCVQQRNETASPETSNPEPSPPEPRPPDLPEFNATIPGLPRRADRLEEFD